jgi:hypothetical protein
VEIPAHHLLDLRDIALRNFSERRQHIENCVIGEAVANELTGAPRGHESSAPQMLQVLGGVGDRQTGFLRQNLDGALTLAELLQQLKPVHVTQVLRNGREMAEEQLFRTLH